MAEIDNYIPSVITVEPSINNPAVTSLPEIEIYFSISMSVGSLNSTSKVNKVLTLSEQGSDLAINLTYVNYFPNLKKLVVVPATPLSAGKLYALRIDALKDGFLSLGNRPLVSTNVFTLKVDSVDLPEITLLSPLNGSLINTQPVFNVQVPSFVSASGEVTLLSLEVSKDVYLGNSGLFYSTQVVATGSTIFTITPNVVFNTNSTYYWRARLESASIAGKWTNIHEFRYAPLSAVNEDSQREYNTSNSKNCIITDLDIGLSNLSSWPTISLKFSEVPVIGTPEDYFSVVYEPIDSVAQQLPVAGTWTSSVSGTVYTFTPSVTILKNKRYTIKVKEVPLTSGLVTEEQIYYFTSTYLPLYASSLLVRAHFGAFASDFSDDLINHHCHRASIQANQMALQIAYVSFDPNIYYSGPRVTDLQHGQYDLVYAVQMWVLNTAMIKLLELKLYELIPCADGTLKIADYSQNMISAPVLKILNEKINSLKRENLEFEHIFNRRGGKPRIPIKASTYPSDIYLPIDRGYDRRGSSQSINDWGTGTDKFSTYRPRRSF